MCTLCYAVYYIGYTNELRSRFRNCHLIKYADDTVIVGLISNTDESEYNEQISEVVLWCKAHNLLLNAEKTKELIFDFRHCNIYHVPLSIDDSIVEICDNFKYIGITFDCKLKWSNHCTLIVSKCKGPSININVHHNPNNVRKGGGGKSLVRILILTKTLKISTIQPCKHTLLSRQ